MRLEKDNHPIIDSSWNPEVGELVWAKVRSHPWWPARVFDPKSATSHAQRSSRPGHFLIAFYGDQTFNWLKISDLLPFVPNFPTKVRQTSTRLFCTAVVEALVEMDKQAERSSNAENSSIDSEKLFSYARSLAASPLSWSDNIFVAAKMRKILLERRDKNSPASEAESLFSFLRPSTVQNSNSKSLLGLQTGTEKKSTVKQKRKSSAESSSRRRKKDAGQSAETPSSPSAESDEKAKTTKRRKRKKIAVEDSQKLTESSEEGTKDIPLDAMEDASVSTKSILVAEPVAVVRQKDQEKDHSDPDSGFSSPHSHYSEDEKKEKMKRGRKRKSVDERTSGKQRKSAGRKDETVEEDEEKNEEKEKVGHEENRKNEAEEKERMKEKKIQKEKVEGNKDEKKATRKKPRRKQEKEIVDDKEKSKLDKVLPINQKSVSDISTENAESNVLHNSNVQENILHEKEYDGAQHDTEQLIEADSREDINNSNNPTSPGNVLTTISKYDRRNKRAKSGDEAEINTVNWDGDVKVDKEMKDNSNEAEESKDATNNDISSNEETGVVKAWVCVEPHAEIKAVFHENERESIALAEEVEFMKIPPKDHDLLEIQTEHITKEKTFISEDKGEYFAPEVSGLEEERVCDIEDQPCELKAEVVFDSEKESQTEMDQNCFLEEEKVSVLDRRIPAAEIVSQFERCSSLKDADSSDLNNDEERLVSDVLFSELEKKIDIGEDDISDVKMDENVTSPIVMKSNLQDASVSANKHPSLYGDDACNFARADDSNRHTAELVSKVDGAAIGGDNADNNTYGNGVPVNTVKVNESTLKSNAVNDTSVDVAGSVIVVTTNRNENVDSEANIAVRFDEGGAKNGNDNLVEAAATVPVDTDDMVMLPTAKSDCDVDKSDNKPVKPEGVASQDNFSDKSEFLNLNSIYESLLRLSRAPDSWEREYEPLQEQFLKYRSIVFVKSSKVISQKPNVPEIKSALKTPQSIAQNDKLKGIEMSKTRKMETIEDDAKEKDGAKTKKRRKKKSELSSDSEKVIGNTPENGKERKKQRKRGPKQPIEGKEKTIVEAKQEKKETKERKNSRATGTKKQKREPADSETKAENGINTENGVLGIEVSDDDMDEPMDLHVELPENDKMETDRYAKSKEQEIEEKIWNQMDEEMMDNVEIDEPEVEFKEEKKNEESEEEEEKRIEKEDEKTKQSKKGKTRETSPMESHAEKGRTRVHESRNSKISPPFPPGFRDYYETKKVEGKKSAKLLTKPDSQPLPQVLHMRFPRGMALPSVSELRALFVRFGHLIPNSVRVNRHILVAQVAYANPQNAELALKGAREERIFGNNHVKFQLRFLPEPQKPASPSTPAAATSNSQMKKTDSQFSSSPIRTPVLSSSVKQKPVSILKTTPLKSTISSSLSSPGAPVSSSLAGSISSSLTSSFASSITSPSTSISPAAVASSLTSSLASPIVSPSISINSAALASPIVSPSISINSAALASSSLTSSFASPIASPSTSINSAAPLHSSSLSSLSSSLLSLSSLLSSMTSSSINPAVYGSPNLNQPSIAQQQFVPQGSAPTKVMVLEHNAQMHPNHAQNRLIQQEMPLQASLHVPSPLPPSLPSLPPVAHPAHIQQWHHSSASAFSPAPFSPHQRPHLGAIIGSPLPRPQSGFGPITNLSVPEGIIPLNTLGVGQIGPRVNGPGMKLGQTEARTAQPGPENANIEGDMMALLQKVSTLVSNKPK